MSEKRASTSDAMAVRAALTELPGRCKYHGEDIENVRDRWEYAGACCETGRPALMRRRALAALDRLEDAARSLVSS